MLRVKTNHDFYQDFLDKLMEKQTFAEMFTKWFLSDNPDGEFEQRFGKWLFDKVEEVNENANK